LTLTGLIDRPVMLDPDEDIHTGTIIIELNPLGAYRLFRLSFAEIQNGILQLEDLIGEAARMIQSQLTAATTTGHKLQVLQNFLLKQLNESAPDPIFDYCIDRISNAKGLIAVARLEKETGYSARWLQRKFAERLGTSPKNLAEIVRFKQFYQAYSAGATAWHLKQLIYQYYYDQSHYLRAFKRFTGSTPTELQGSMNELSIRNFGG
jgi:AraC-like DNA-binding protein